MGVPNMLLRSILLLLSLVCIFSTALEEEEMEGVVKTEVKKPKLFYVSTLSTTSTVSTLTVCYVTSATLASCTNLPAQFFPQHPMINCGTRTQRRRSLCWKE